MQAKHVHGLYKSCSVYVCTYIKSMGGARVITFYSKCECCISLTVHLRIIYMYI